MAAKPSPKTVKERKKANPCPEMVITIGETAGKVWQFLHQNGEASATRIAGEIKATTRDTERAIGWLAREGKLEFYEAQKGENIRLSGSSKSLPR